MSKLSYNRKEAAAELGISLFKLDAEKRAGRIFPRYAHGVPLYEHDELKRWLEALPSEPKSA
ncbi:hypothetical protein [Mycobacteroides abscessus]